MASKKARYVPGGIEAWCDQEQRYKFYSINNPDYLLPKRMKHISEVIQRMYGGAFVQLPVSQEINHDD